LEKFLGKILFGKSEFGNLRRIIEVKLKRCFNGKSEEEVIAIMKKQVLILLQLCPVIGSRTCSLFRRIFLRSG